MWWVGYYFDVNPALQSIAGAGGVLAHPVVGGATSIANKAFPLDMGVSGSSAGHDLPDILEPSQRNFIIDAGGVVNRHQVGGALWVVSYFPPQSPEDEFEDWLILNNFDFVQAELDHERHALGV
jgi:hypothetical protein